MQRALLLAVLLHVWLVLVFGNATGTAAPGEGVWGSLTVKLTGRSGGEPGAPPGEPNREWRDNGAPGSGDPQRQGGQVRPESPATQDTGAAALGRWNPREVAPEAARTEDLSDAPPTPPRSRCRPASSPSSVRTSPRRPHAHPHSRRPALICPPRSAAWSRGRTARPPRCRPRTACAPRRRRCRCPACRPSCRRRSAAWMPRLRPSARPRCRARAICAPCRPRHPPPRPPLTCRRPCNAWRLPPRPMPQRPCPAPPNCEPPPPGGRGLAEQHAAAVGRAAAGQRGGPGRRDATEPRQRTARRAQPLIGHPVGQRPGRQPRPARAGAAPGVSRQRRQRDPAAASGQPARQPGNAGQHDAARVVDRAAGTGQRPRRARAR